MARVAMVQQASRLGDQMANFQEALNFILKHEGSTYFHDPVSGEKSKYGITEKLLINIKYGITNPNNLQMSDIENVYMTVFWNNLSQVKSQLVANKVFDMMVNMGTGQAVKLLQASLNSMGAACVIDGKLGPHTMIILNSADEDKLLSELVLQCESFYKRIAKGNNAKYLKGWLTRARDIGTGERDEVAYNVLRSGKDDKVIKG